MRRAFSTRPSRSMMSSVASPAAQAAGLPPNVKRWLNGCSLNASATRPVAIVAPIGA